MREQEELPRPLGREQTEAEPGQQQGLPRFQQDIRGVIAGGADQVGEHHSDLTAFGAVFWMWRLGYCDVVAASTGGALPLASLRRAAMASSSFTRCPSAVTPSCFRCSSVRLGRTVLVYLILAECCLVLPEAQAPQPDHNVHDGAHTIGGIRVHTCRGSEGVQGGVGCSQGFGVARAERLPAGSLAESVRAVVTRSTMSLARSARSGSQGHWGETRRAARCEAHVGQ